MTIYTTLREANVARQIEWCPDVLPDLSFRGCELAGEIGELCELLITNTVRTDWPEKVREELGDGFICVDLLAICANVDLVMEAHATGLSSPYPTFNEAAGHLGWRVGQVCNIVKKLERERQGWKGSRATAADLAQHLGYLVGALNWVTDRMGFDRKAVITAKFNATSEKVGLETRLA